MTILGIDTELLNAGAAGGFGTVLILILRLILVKFLGENRKIDIQGQLVHLASDTMERTERMLQAYEGNTEAIKQVGIVLGDVQKAFMDLSERVLSGIESVKTDVDPLVESIQVIRDNLLKTTETVVVLRDNEGVDVASFKATPEQDKNGNTILVVTFDYKE